MSRNTFLAGKDVSTLLLAVLDKSLVKHHGASRLTTGWRRVFNAPPSHQQDALSCCYEAQLAVKKKKWMWWTEGLFDHFPSLFLVEFLKSGSPLPKVFWCAVYKMDMWNKSNWWSTAYIYSKSVKFPRKIFEKCHSTLLPPVQSNSRIIDLRDMQITGAVFGF